MADDGLRMQDPRTRYPQPPFPKQPQAAPGIASKMELPPDHGETSYRGHARLAGRKALITGADSGIGRAAAIAFAREGADVALVYLPSEESDAGEVARLIEAEGRRALKLPGDITDRAFCDKLVADAVADMGGIDILVNNAAKQVSVESINDLSEEQFDKTFKTNVHALLRISKAATPHLKPGASVINTSSIQGSAPSENLLDYAATKAAIIAFSKAYAKQ